MVELEGKNFNIHIKCPKCSSESDFEAHSVINATEENGLKEKVMDGSMFLHVCPECGAKINVEYSFVYHQPEDAFMVQYVVNDEEMKQAVSALTNPNEEQRKTVNILSENNTIIRIVRSKAQLLEKITIYEAGLDDRAVEIFKHIAAGNFLKENPDKQISKILFNMLARNPEREQDEIGRQMEAAAFEDGMIRVVQIYCDNTFTAQAVLSPSAYKKIHEDFISAMQPLREDKNLVVDARYAGEILRLKNAKSNPAE